MRKYLVATALAIAVLSGTCRGYSQHWSLGGNMGLSLLGGSAGFQATPMVELLINRNIGVGTEFSLNTQYGAPMIWYPYLKYYIGIQESALKPYASVGPVLALNVPNGPCVGFLFGSGVSVPVANGLYLDPNVLFGPIFGFGGGTLPLILRGYYWGFETYGLTSFTIPGTTIIAFSVRAGIRYEM